VNGSWYVRMWDKNDDKSVFNWWLNVNRRRISRRRAHAYSVSDCIIVDRLMTNSRRAGIHSSRHSSTPAARTRPPAGQHASWTGRSAGVVQSSWTDVLDGSAQYGATTRGGGGAPAGPTLTTGHHRRLARLLAARRRSSFSRWRLCTFRLKYVSFYSRRASVVLSVGRCRAARSNNDFSLTN